MNRGEVFVRALGKDGKWDAIDVFDLDDESFRAFILDKLALVGCFFRITEPQGDPITLKEKVKE